MLLDCLNNVKQLWLDSCGVSQEMRRKLKERGEEVGCSVIIMADLLSTPTLRAEAIPVSDLGDDR